MHFLLWNVKGYAAIQLTEEALHSDKYSFNEIKHEESNIIKKVENNLENGGVIFGLVKKKVIKALYFFKLTTKDNEKCLVFDKKIVLDEANKCIKEFENDIDTILGSAVAIRNDIDKVIWREKEIKKEQTFNSGISAIKTVTILGIGFCCIIATLMIIISTFLSTAIISEYSVEEIKNSEYIMNYVSDLNNYDYSDTILTFSEISNQTEFAVIEIIIPTLFAVLGYALLIVSLINLLKLIKDVTDHKSLFNYDKNELFNVIIFQSYISLLFLLRSFILWLLLGLIFDIIGYIFNCCVQLTNRKK